MIDYIIGEDMTKDDLSNGDVAILRKGDMMVKCNKKLISTKDLSGMLTGTAGVRIAGNTASGLTLTTNRGMFLLGMASMLLVIFISVRRVGFA